MAEHEFYREKTVIHHTAAHSEETPARVEHVYYDPQDQRGNWHTRSVVRGEIISFRRGVFLVVDVVEILLAVEFILKLFVVSAGPFTAFMDAITYPLIAPFGSITTWLSPYVALNWSILIALLAYTLVAYLLVALFESGVRAAYRR